jgi:hypothetical protein
MNQVALRDREIDGARHQVHIDPGVHAESGSVAGLQDGGERVESCRLTLQLRGAGLESSVVVRVAPPAHLDEQGVESVLARGSHHGCDRVRRGESGSQHPERANLGRCGFLAPFR